MRLTLGGVSINLGGEVESKIQGAATCAVVATAREWLKVAVHVLGCNHPAIVAMQKLVADYDAGEMENVR